MLVTTVIEQILRQMMLDGKRCGKLAEERWPNRKRIGDVVRS